MKKVDQEVSCPSCGWHPDGKEHWKCHCGHTWDVFSTGGRCPACLYHWEKTQCAPQAGGCDSISPHLDWYGNLDSWLSSELTFLEVPEEKQRRGSRGL